MEPPAGILGRALAAASDGDRERLLAMFCADAELRPALAGTIEGSLYRGRAAIARWWDQAMETWEEYGAECHGELAMGDHHLALATMLLRSRGSHVPVTQRVTLVGTSRDGLLARVWVSVDLPEALEELARLVREAGG